MWRRTLYFVRCMTKRNACVNRLTNYFSPMNKRTENTNKLVTVFSAHLKDPEVLKVLVFTMFSTPASRMIHEM